MAIYSFAIKRTISAYKDYKDLSAQVQLAKNAPLNAALLESKLAEMNFVLGNQQVNEINAQQNLLGAITNFCQANNVVLREFPKTINTEEKDFLLETNVFEIEGSFSKLLKFIYLLEQKNKVGRIASVSFKTKKDYKTKSISLSATLYVQNIKNSRNEDQHE